MYKPFKMKGKSPLMKKLVGKQHNLPEHLKAKIKAAPESPNKKYKDSAMKKKSCGSAYKKYGSDSAMKMYKNKKNKSNKPCKGCKSICPSCRGKK